MNRSAEGRRIRSIVPSYTSSRSPAPSSRRSEVRRLPPPARAQRRRRRDALAHRDVIDLVGFLRTVALVTAPQEAPPAHPKWKG
jgi:hypothetical protein